MGGDGIMAGAACAENRGKLRGLSLEAVWECALQRTEGVASSPLRHHAP